MSLQLKKLLMVMLSAAMSVCAGMLVRSIYEHQRIWLAGLALGLATAAQIVVTVLQSPEEEELKLGRELRLASSRQKLREDEVLSEQLIAEIRQGNYESVVEIINVRDLMHKSN
jgi:hypothetical protein